MTYSTEHPAIAPIESVPHSELGTETVIKAIRNAEALLPRFTQVVRTAAGVSELTVALSFSGECETDGLVVKVPVTPDWADMDPESPCTCDDFSCVYCLTIGLLLHEAAHIAHGSTATFTYKASNEVMAFLDEALIAASAADGHDWIEDFRNSYGPSAARGPNLERLGRLQEHMRLHELDPETNTRTGPDHIYEVAGYFNPYGALILNALEDTRINKLMGKERSALPPPLEVMVVEHLLATGVPGEGWNEAPPAIQAGAAIAYRVEYDLALDQVLGSETVKAFMADEAIIALVDTELDSVTHAAGYAMAIVYLAWQKYGLFLHQREPKPDGSRGRVLKRGHDRGEDGTLSNPQRLRDYAESTEVQHQVHRAQQRDRAATDPTNPHNSLGRSAPDRAIQEALRRGPTDVPDVPEDVGDLSNQHVPGGGLQITSGDGLYPVMVYRPGWEVREEPFDFGQVLPGIRYPVHHSEDLAVDRYANWAGQNPDANSLHRLREALGFNRRSAHDPNLPYGRLHGSKLARVPTGGRRVFRRLEKAKKRSYAVLIGVDLSGSTHSRAEGDRDVNDILVELAYRQAELLAAVGVPFMVVGHTGRHRYDGDYLLGELSSAERRLWPSSTTTDLYLAKTFAEPWRREQKLAMLSFPACAQNLDGQTMQTYIRLLAAQRATDRLLLYYTDGAMPAEDSTRQQAILESELSRAAAWSKRKDHRLSVIGVGYNTDSPKQYGLDTIEVNGSDGIKSNIQTVVSGLAERIARTIK